MVCRAGGSRRCDIILDGLKQLRCLRTALNQVDKFQQLWTLICNVINMKVVSVRVCVRAGVMELVESFQYLGSIISSNGDLYEELSGRLAKAAKMFGCLRQSIFVNQSLSIETRRCAYLATVVATWLYGSETWAVKADRMWRLEVFHNWCVRGVLGVSRYQQWRNHISSEQLAVEFEMCNGISGLLVQCRLCWLGHVARMEDDRLPKQLLFGELLTVRLRHGPKLCWRDVIVKDIQ